MNCNDLNSKRKFKCEIRFFVAEINCIIRMICWRPPTHFTIYIFVASCIFFSLLFIVFFTFISSFHRTWGHLWFIWRGTTPSLAIGYVQVALHCCYSYLHRGDLSIYERRNDYQIYLFLLKKLPFVLNIHTPLLNLTLAFPKVAPRGLDIDWLGLWWRHLLRHGARGLKIT